MMKDKKNTELLYPRAHKSIIITVLFYGAETWLINQKSFKTAR